MGIQFNEGALLLRIGPDEILVIEWAIATTSIAPALVGRLAEGEQPVQTVAPLGAIVAQLSLVEPGGRRPAHQRDAVDRVVALFNRRPRRRIRRAR